jgi:ATP adenylyltransferase
MYQDSQSVSVLMTDSDSESCPFCVLQHDKVFQGRVENTVLFETDNFVVVPALGSFVAGYLLIATKPHVRNIAHLPDQLCPELQSACHAVADIVRTKYGPVVTFEHGNAGLTFQGPSCINHAHIHIVPFALDVWSLVEAPFAHKEIRLRPWHREVPRDESYIFVQDNNGRARYYTTASEFPRQYIRRRICQLMGGNYREKWNWDFCQFPENIRKTIDDLRPTFDVLSASHEKGFPVAPL